MDIFQQLVRPAIAELPSIQENRIQLDQELTKSAISPGIARLNFIPIAPFTPSPYEEVISEGKQLILGHWLEKKNQQKKYPNHYQQVTTEIERVLRAYNHLDEGGWYCGGGYNPYPPNPPYQGGRRGDEQDWGCLKPNTPRLSGEYEKKADGKWHKVIKYESPLGQELGLFILKIDYRTARKLAKKNHELKSFETFFGKAYDINGENYKLDDECDRFWEWVIACPSLIIYLTEGAKKAACLLSQGYCAIGASGIWGFYRTKASNGEKVDPYLHPLLTRFVKKERHFYFAFDSDNPDEKPETVEQVNLAIGKTGKLLRKTKGVKTYIIHWNHELGKGVDDLIFNHGIGAFQQAVENRINILTNTWLNSKKLSDITVTVNQRYLNCELPPPEKYSIIQIRGNQGTGKTVTIAKALAKLASNEYQILLPTHRETLAREGGENYSIDHRLEAEENKSYLGLALCLDSLRNKQGVNIDDIINDPRNLILVIDEVMQFIDHFLEGGTEVKEYRQEILANFIRLINKALDGGQIIIADADLDDRALGFIANLLGCQREFLLPTTYTIDNTYNDSGFDSYIMPSDGAWWTEVESSLEKDERILVYDGSQKRKSRLSTQHIYHRLKAKYPDKKGLIIDSETLSITSSDINHIKNEWKKLLEEYDYIICSPSIETGISIPVSVKIDKVFGYTAGNVHPQNFIQGLIRYRGLCPRYLFINHIGFGGGNIYSAKEIKQKTNTKRLYDQNFLSKGADDSEFLGDFRAIETDLNDILLNQYCIFKACKNLAYANYKENILTLLKLRGHRVITDIYDLDRKHKSLLNDEFDEDKKTLVKEQAQLINNAPDVNKAEYQRLCKQKQKTKQEYWAIQKQAEKNKYGESNLSEKLIETEILKDLHPKLKLQYFLNDPELAKSADRKDIKERKYKTTYESAQRTHYVKAKLLEGLGLPNLILELEELTNNETWINKDTPCLKRFVIQCQLYANDIDIIFNLKVPENVVDKPIQFVNRLLKKIGKELTVKYKNNSFRAYQLESFVDPETIEKIFSYWDKNSEALVVC